MELTSLRRLTAAQWAVAAFVLALTAVGLYLRLRFLGELGLDRYRDEDIMAVAVQGVREHGYPLMPTGMIYTRALPLLYMMAASTALFDFNEFALRLPPALFGTGLIPLSYLVARRFLPVYGALLVAVLVCFSAWQIDVSRTARMYAPFSFFYMLAIYFFIVEYVDGRSNWPWKTLLASLAAISLQVLGMSLAILFLLHLIEKPLWRQKWQHLACGFAIVISTAFIDYQGSRLFRIPKSAGDIAMDFSPESGTGVIHASMLDSLTGFLSRFSGRLYDLPLELLSAVADRYPWALSALVIIILSSVVAMFIRFRRSMSATEMVIVAAASLFSIIHQFYIVAILALLLLMVSGHGPGERTEDRPNSMLLVAGVAGVCAFFWSLMGVASWGFSTDSIRTTVTEMLNFPRVRPWLMFFSDRWHLAAIAMLGVVFAAMEFRRVSRLTPALVLAASLVGIALLIGGVPSQIRVRYVFNAELPVYMMAVLAIIVLTRAAADRVTRSKKSPTSTPPRYASAVSCALIGLGALATPDFSPSRAFAVTAMSEESRPMVEQRYALSAGTDRKTTSLYIRDHLQPDDKIAAIDWITVYYYVGRLDYWLRDEAADYQFYGPASAPRDTYVGSRVLQSAADLRRMIADLCGQRLWIAIPSEDFRNEKKSSPEFEQLFLELADHVVYRGHEGGSAVYLIDRSACNWPQ